MSVTTAQTISLLENVLFESPSIASANAAQWVTLSQSDALYSDVAGLAQAMAATSEIGIAKQVVRYYDGALLRSPSGAEVTYYVRIAEAGRTAAQIAQGASGVPQTVWNQIAGYFAASPEFAQLHSGANVVTMLYQDILGRTPSADESAYYQKLLGGGTSVSTLVQYFVTSPEYLGKVRAGIDGDLAAYGFTVTENPSSAPPQSVMSANTGLAIVVDTAGATYASQPSYVGSTAGPGAVYFISDKAALTVDRPTVFNSIVASGAQAITALETGIGAHHIASGIYGGNTYVVESQTGTPGPTDTTVLELTGIHALASTTQAGLITIFA